MHNLMNTNASQLELEKDVAFRLITQVVADRLLERVEFDNDFITGQTQASATLYDIKREIKRFLPRRPAMRIRLLKEWTEWKRVSEDYFLQDLETLKAMLSASVQNMAKADPTDFEAWEKARKCMEDALPFTAERQQYIRHLRVLDEFISEQLSPADEFNARRGTL